MNAVKFPYVRIDIDEQANIKATGWPFSGLADVNVSERPYSFVTKHKSQTFYLFCEHNLSNAQRDHFVTVVLTNPTWVEIDLGSY